MPIQQGMGQHTPAVLNTIMRGGSSRPAAARRRRSSTRKRAASSGSRKASRKSSGRKMKFGSPAWQKKYKVGKYRK
jgi:hypothetical protein